MDLLQLALAALSGGIVALLLTVFGGGGSVLAVPLLLYVVGVRDPHMAIGASACGCDRSLGRRRQTRRDDARVQSFAAPGARTGIAMLHRSTCPAGRL